jgi:glucose dehydrogenase
VNGPNQDWAVYGGQVTGNHYSPLTQITPANVGKLKIAWSFDTHEKGGLQTNPLIVGGRLFAYTPSQQVLALDAATGRELWRFSPGKPGLQPARGFTYWTDGHENILFAGALSLLFALDPATGKPIGHFGEGGFIDLRKSLTEGDYTKGFVAPTTPGVIYKDMIIVGFRDPETKPALPGDIRAFDVHTGKLRWTFHTIPHPGEFGYETWPKDAWKTAGAANNWAGMAVDEQRGIVYAPTGSAVNDFYGDDRHGDDLFADTLLALDANTGKRIWHFQGVHHDIWDRDFPSPPALVTVQSGGHPVDAVLQTTKQGMIFLFDRATGKPLFPIEEHSFPASDVPGELASATQPVTSTPAPFARQRLTEDMLTTRTPEAHAWALEQFRTFRSAGQFKPLTVDQPTVVFPGFDGGAEWGGSAVDPRSGVAYINSNDIAWTAGLTAARAGASPAERLYTAQCAVCHGVDRRGAPPAFPSLEKVQTRLPDSAVIDIIHGGKGRMPSFPGIQDADLKMLLDYLKSGIDATAKPAPAVLLVGGNRKEIAGAAIYDKQCAICHGEDLLGNASNMPGLIGIRARQSDAQIEAIIHNGKGRMPPFPRISPTQTADLLRFLSPPHDLTASDKQEMEGGPPTGVARYSFTGYHKFMDPDGYPAVAPPWGTLNAIDLNTGAYLWKVPLGQYPALAAKGMADTGSENYGGPIITASGVLFIGATIYDRKLRAFDMKTGHLLWEAQLPYAGVATPATYMVNGKQYVVIATSGQRDINGPQGAAYVCFALP